MFHFKFTTILILGLLIGLPLSALEKSYEKSHSIADNQRLLIDQQRLRLMTFGISFYPVTTTIRGYEGTELIVRVDEHCSFGFKNPVMIDFEETAEGLRLITAFKHNKTAGINIGSLDIEIMIPSRWDGDLVLEKLKTKTSIENLDISSISGKTSITELSIEDCIFDSTELELGADTDLAVYRSNVGDCRIRGTMGKITAQSLRGTIDAETFDGDISIGFGDFHGVNKLVSRLGRICVGLPEDTAADIELSSRLSSVKCEFSLSSSSALSKGLISGSIGEAASGNTLSLHSGDGDIILTPAFGDQL